MKCCACIIPGVPLPFISRGWGNGYVLIPQGHPLYGKFDFYAPEFEGLEVHGGITYSDKNIPIKTPNLSLTNLTLIIGFSDSTPPIV